MFLNPANSQHCPDVYTQKVLLTNEELLEDELSWKEAEIDFNEAWNCKYHIKTAMSLDPYNGKGFVMVQVEQYGFEDHVYLIVQPREKFYDFKTTNDPE